MPPKKNKKPSFLWVLDQWDTLDVANDTTLLLARAASDLGYVSDIAQVDTLRIHANRGRARIFADVSTLNADRTTCENRRTNVDLARYSQIHYRVDPPVDAHYTDPLKLLSLAQLPIVNRVDTLIGQSEKLLALTAPGLAPTSSVVSSQAALQALRSTSPFQGQPVVLKPLFTAQSQGVQKLDPQAPTPKVTQPLLVQPYLPAILTEGELRTWWVDGQCVGALRKFPLKNDFRVLIDQGSRLEKVDAIPRAVRAKFPRVQKLLRQHGIRLAAIDWIGAEISDFNFTSPGLLVQLEKVSGLPISHTIISKLAKRDA